MINVIYYNSVGKSTQLNFPDNATLLNVHEEVAELESLPRDAFYLTCGGKISDRLDGLSNDSVVRCNLRVLGGKGGFGSMLRAIGARIEKTTNHEACRDLSGRRMRDVNNEKQIAEWLKNKEIEETEREKKRVAKLERVLNPTHKYEDVNYTSNLQENARNVDDALESALNRRKTSGVKRKLETTTEFHKKKNSIWLGVSEDEESSGDEEINAEDKNSTNSDDLSTNQKSNVDGNERTFIGVSKDEDNSETPQTVVKENELKRRKRDTKESEITQGKRETKESEITQGKRETKESETTQRKRETKESEITQRKRETKESETTQSASDKIIEPVDVTLYNSAEQLKEVGLERLKATLLSLGMKCGGTLHDRAQRLFLTKDADLQKLDPSLFRTKKT